jgi:two-component system cell cycle response regulator
MSTREILRGWNILIVEDDPLSLDVVVQILTFYGGTVHTAGNGKEGLEKANEVHPDFVITDLSMPVMNGWAFIAAMKGDPVLASIPIFALTATSVLGDRDRAIAAGCHNYLNKPLKPSVFIQQLLKMIGDIPELAKLFIAGSR